MALSFSVYKPIDRSFILFIGRIETSSSLERRSSLHRKLTCQPSRLSSTKGRKNKKNKPMPRQQGEVPRIYVFIYIYRDICVYMYICACVGVCASLSLHREEERKFSLIFLFLTSRQECTYTSQQSNLAFLRPLEDTSHFHILTTMGMLIDRRTPTRTKMCRYKDVYIYGRMRCV